MGQYFPTAGLGVGGSGAAPQPFYQPPPTQAPPIVGDFSANQNPEWLPPQATPSRAYTPMPAMDGYSLNQNPQELSSLNRPAPQMATGQGVFSNPAFYQQPQQGFQQPQQGFQQPQQGFQQPMMPQGQSPMPQTTQYGPQGYQMGAFSRMQQNTPWFMRGQNGG